MLFVRVISFLLLLATAWIAFAEEPATRVKLRAKPPTWSQDVLDAFFDDAREQLVGERPQAGTSAVSGHPILPVETFRRDGMIRWSDLVDADTLASEIKRLNIALAAGLSKPAQFKGGGNLDCRRDFGLLAVMFGGIADFDKEVRWQESATTMQRAMLETSQVCKAASDQSYSAAQNVQLLLADLLRGQTAAPPKLSEKADGLADRTLLMQRMEQALEKNISLSLANAREFRKKKRDIVHEAQLLALLAQVIRQEGYEFTDDETYLNYSDQLREHSRELRRACDESNYEAARAAAGKVSQSCSECHEGYRG